MKYLNMHVSSHLTLQSHGGRLIVAGRTLDGMLNRKKYDMSRSQLTKNEFLVYEDSASERDRLSVFSIVDLQLSGPISNHSGMTHLPEMIAHLDIDLPSCQDSLFGGLSKVKKLAWWVLFSNSAASFSVGLTIAGAIHFALAEVRKHSFYAILGCELAFRELRSQ